MHEAKHFRKQLKQDNPLGSPIALALDDSVTIVIAILSTTMF